MRYAQAVVVAECVARFGFEYPVQPYADVLATERSFVQSQIDRQFGVSDRAEAETYGYGTAPSPPLSAEEQRMADQAGITAVLFGVSDPVNEAGSQPASLPAEGGLEVPEGGCFGEANRRLDGVQELNMGDHARTLMVRAGEDAKTEPAYQDVVQDWRACMARAGFEATSPLSDPAVVELIKSRENPEVPSSEEIAMAVADVECKAETDLVSRLSAVSETFEEGQVEANLLVLQENRQQLEHQLDLAIAEIEKSGGLR